MVSIVLLLSTVFCSLYAEFISPTDKLGAGLSRISEAENDEVNKICGQQPGLNKINDGTIAKKGQFPWAVAIEGNNQRFCSGTIISPRHVLTAAHCVVNHEWVDGDECKRASLKSASHEVDDKIVGGVISYGGNCNFAADPLNMTGSSCTKDDMKRVTISAVAWERRYRDKPYEEKCSNFDIAIVEVETPFEWSDFARPACLLRSDLDYTNMIASFYGFGYVKNGQFEATLFGARDERDKTFYPDLRFGSGKLTKNDTTFTLQVIPDRMSETEQSEMETTRTAQVESGDSGGGIIFSGCARKMLIGVAAEAINKRAFKGAKRERMSQGAQIYPHSQEICELTGVCPAEHCFDD